MKTTDINVEDARVEKFGSVPSMFGHFIVMLRVKRWNWKKSHKFIVANPLHSPFLSDDEKELLVDVSKRIAEKHALAQEDEPE